MAGASVAIRFHANGGAFPSGDTEVFVDGWSGDPISDYVDEPIRDGYIFVGWSTDQNAVVAKCTMTSPIDELIGYSYGYAVWKLDVDTIIFSSTIGVFASDNSTSKTVLTKLNGTVSLSSIIETPVKPSYILAGWSTTETGSVEYLPDATPTINADTILYAVWELRDDIGIIQLQLDTSDATATAEDIIEGKTAYVNGEKLTGTATAGAAVETVNFSFVAHSNGSSGSNFGFWYIDDSGQPISTTIPSKSGSFTIPVMKGCVVFTDGTNVDTGWSVSGPSKWEMSYHGYGFVAVADNDITFTITRRGISKE